MWIASVVLSQVGYALAAVATGSAQLSLATLVSSFAGTYVGLIGGSLLLGRGDLRSLGPRFRAIDVPLGLAAGLFGSFVLVPAIAWPIERLFPGTDLGEDAQRLAEATPGWRIWVLAVCVAGITPFAEEMFFRGVVQARLATRVRPAIAVAIAATLFGLAHLQIAQLLPLVALGALFGLLALRSARLGPAIVAHATFNALTVLYLATS